MLTPAERCRLIARNTAELISEEELLALLASGTEIRHYIGFEISGLIHLGGGLITMSKIRDFIEAGVRCHVLLADWHTWINDKLGGDRKTIRRIATGYFTEGLRAAMRCVGGDPTKVTFVLASDLYRDNPDYWSTVIEVSKHTTLARMQRSISIMGRAEGESIDFAKLIYPAMQAADIFAQGIHLAHAGMDQRKAHVIAREVALQMRINPIRTEEGKTVKPVAVHHPLILGLAKPPVWPIPEGSEREMLSAMKMSKSNPKSAVFIHDSPDDIRAKIRGAFCTPQDVSFNPILNWIERLVFGLGDEEFRVDRSPAHGGPMTFNAYSEVEAAFASGNLHPMDAKTALADRLVDRLAPARDYFASEQAGEMLHEIEQLIA